jgi:hypothetical protein
LPIEIDFGAAAPAMDQAAWEQEYEHNVSADAILTPARPSSGPPTKVSFDPAEVSSAISNDPFFDPARFDPWECLYERFF